MTWGWIDSLEGRFNHRIWVRAIYLGFPVWVRADDADPEGAEVAGLFSWVMTVLPFNGELFLYDQVERPWPKSLWDWLTAWAVDDPEVGP